MSRHDLSLWVTMQCQVSCSCHDHLLSCTGQGFSRYNTTIALSARISIPYQQDGSDKCENFRRSTCKSSSVAPKLYASKTLSHSCAPYCTFMTIFVTSTWRLKICSFFAKRVFLRQYPSHLGLFSYSLTVTAGSVGPRYRQIVVIAVSCFLPKSCPECLNRFIVSTDPRRTWCVYVWILLNSFPIPNSRILLPLRILGFSF